MFMPLYDVKKSVNLFPKKILGIGYQLETDDRKKRKALIYSYRNVTFNVMKIKGYKKQILQLIALAMSILHSGCSSNESSTEFEDSDNEAPVASNIIVSGNFEYGEALTVSYTYTDAENDTEVAPNIQWYRADDSNGFNKVVITTGTSATHTLSVSDIGRYLSVEVTPNANGGALTGATVTSAYTSQITAEERPSFTVKDYTKIVAGFYPSWKTSLLPIADIKWNHLTHVIYSFAIPENNGDLNIDNLIDVSDLVSTAHANGVEAFFSIGGAVGSERFIALSADEALRRKFVETVEEYAYLNNFDGIDVDWEGWTNPETIDPNETEGLLMLLKDLRNALARHNIKICMDVFPADWGGKHYTAEMFDYVDWVNIMAYDFSGGWSASPAHHASVANSVQALNYWNNTRGLPKNKTVMGVAFYGKEFTEPANVNDNTVFNRPYRDILAANPDAHLTDQIGNIYYTGQQTIRQQAMLIANDNEYLGAMIWEIAHDTPDESKSLLTALDDVLNP